MRITIVLFLLTRIAICQESQIKLFKFSNSTCDNEQEASRIRTRIISKDISTNILTVKISATATCCVGFNPKILFKKEILNLDFEETGTPCECTCCYEFIYQIVGIKNDNIKITFRNKNIETSDEKYLTYPVKYKILHGDTINQVDKYGLKQGVWTLPSDSLKKERFVVFDNDILVRNVTLFSNGRIQSDLISEKISFEMSNELFNGYSLPNKYIEYYESGNKKRECYNAKQEFNNLYKEGNCKEWDETGKLVYEGKHK